MMMVPGLGVATGATVVRSTIEPVGRTKLNGAW
jgi:hypothetical protein